MTEGTAMNGSAIDGRPVVSKLPMQSASLFSKNGVLRRREVNFQNTEITDSSFLITTPQIGGARKDELMSSKRSKPSFKESVDLKRQFKSGLKKVQKSQLMFYFQFLLLIVSTSIRVLMIVAGGHRGVLLLPRQHIQGGRVHMHGHYGLPWAHAPRRHHGPLLQGQGPLSIIRQVRNRKPPIVFDDA